MNPIGGYFELELRKEEEYHKDAIRLNSGRNAFEYILRAREYKKVYVPYYTCDVLLETINNLKLDYEFYHINEKLEPLIDFKRIGKDEAFLFTNYFGINGKKVKELSKSTPNLIIDNSQAFFENPIAGIDTFYSPRKFFGIPDGAYLFTDKKLNETIGQDISFERFSHLLKRLDLEAEAAYSDFKRNDDLLKGQEIKEMSKLTKSLLCNIDYEYSKKKRLENFLILHKQLSKYNKLNLKLDVGFVPMVYPFLTDRDNLKQYLIRNKIYVATYWPNILEWCKADTVEYNLVNNLIPLPIDQRYGIEEMKKITELILR